MIDGREKIELELLERKVSRVSIDRESMHIVAIVLGVTIAVVIIFFQVYAILDRILPHCMHSI